MEAVVPVVEAASKAASFEQPLFLEDLYVDKCGRAHSGCGCSRGAVVGAVQLRWQAGCAVAGGLCGLGPSRPRRGVGSGDDEKNASRVQTGGCGKEGRSGESEEKITREFSRNS